MKNKRKHNNKENKIKLGKISWLIIIAVFVICIGLIGIGVSWYSYTGGILVILLVVVCLC